MDQAWLPKAEGMADAWIEQDTRCGWKVWHNRTAQPTHPVDPAPHFFWEVVVIQWEFQDPDMEVR